MFKTIGRIINWCGEFKGKLYIGFIFSFLSNIFAAMPVMVAAYTVGMLMEAEKGSGTFDRKWIGYSILIILGLVFFRFLFDYLRAKFQEAIGYELIARDRLAVGDALKRVSLGYFQQMNTGNILSSITTGLGTLETMGIRMINSFIGGYLNFLVVFLCLCVFSPVTALIASAQCKKGIEQKIGNADDKAREIIDEALKTAEAKKREGLLEVKEESIRTKNELDREIKERRAEVTRYERRVQQKEENIDKKADAIEKREASLASREESLNRMKEEVSRLNEQRVQELERISGLTSEQAKDYLLKIVEDEVKHESAVMIKEMESRAKEEADKKAKEYVVNAIQRCAADHVSETTISVVQLPNDEMKGRIIGREGRNIRTLETMTGVDLIIDDTPEAVILSGFDPIRREVARIALEKLIVDGRIHPARIEEMVEKAQKEVETMIREEGEAATLEVGVHGIHPELVRLLGKMKFRTSYGQNALKHSIEVAQLSGLLAAELGLDVRLAKRAGLLHDIGKAVDHEMEGSHIQLGAELCRKYKENATVINAVESHHGDVEPTSLIACIVQAADTISAARPGARRETLETYTSRLRQLEDITNNFKGVDKSFAIQAGREVRVMVVPEQISDADMVLLARDISKQIEAELEYPGQIKVNVIRESRVIDYAK